MPRITLQLSGKSVEWAKGETVPMALERAGYALPYNRRASACGECKVKVMAGRVDQGIVLDMALSLEERGQGYGLMCMAKPVSPKLSTEWGSADARPRLFPPQEGIPRPDGGLVLQVARTEGASPAPGCMTGSRSATASACPAPTARA